MAYVERKRSAWIEEESLGYAAGVGTYATAVDREAVEGLLGPAPGRVVDLPCGSGRLSAAWSGRRVLADVSPGMLRLARGDGGEPAVRVDAFRLPFRDGSVDAMLMIRLLLHYPDPAPLLREARRVLRPGGRLVVDTLNPISLRRLLAVFLDLWRGSRLRRVWVRSEGQVRRLLRDAGLHLEGRAERYLLPTRAYRRLPAALHAAWAATEARWVPCRCRVLTFWRAERHGP